MFKDWGYVQVEIRASKLLRNFRGGGGKEGGNPFSFSNINFPTLGSPFMSPIPAPGAN